MEDAIISVIQYFAHFSYPPTFDELYRYLPIRVSKRLLHAQLDMLLKRNGIISSRIPITDIFTRKTDGQREVYTLPQYSIYFKKRLSRQAISLHKLQTVRNFITVAKKVPFISLLGVSGSIAMANGAKKDDIDIFVVSAPGRMWISRLILLGIAQIFGLRRGRGLKHAPNMICMNLFFDGISLEIPEEKRSRFTAHELLQMHVLFDRHDTYHNLLVKNRWIMDFLPNNKISKQIREHHFSPRWIFDRGEQFARFLQMINIRKHRTHEYVTDTQAWFFPRDASNIFTRKKI